MKEINNATGALKLASAYDLKGKVSLRLDETIVPVVLVDDLAPDDSAKGERCGISRGVPAVAAQTGFLLVVPAINTRLSVLSFAIENFHDDCWIGLVTVADRDTLVAAAGTTGSLMRMGSPVEVGTTSQTLPVVGSTWHVGAAAAQLGQVAWYGAGASVVGIPWQLPFPLSAWNNGAGAAPAAIVLWGGTNNVQKDMSVLCEQVPIV